MFFNKQKAQANFIAGRCIEVFKLVFLDAKLSGSNQSLMPYPYGFFSDEYIIGYLTGFTFSWLDIKYRGREMTFSKREEVLLRVFGKIAPYEVRSMKLIASQVNSASMQEHSLFFEGYDVASIFVALANGVALKADFSHPKLDEARSIAPTLRKTEILISNSQNGTSDSSTLASALLLVSIGSYIRSEYVN